MKGPLKVQNQFAKGIGPFLIAFLFFAGYPQPSGAVDYVVTTLAGSGYTDHDNGKGTASGFAMPMGVAVDSSGNVFVADQGNCLIRKIAPDGIVTTLAGSGTIATVDGGGASAAFDFPMGIAVDASGLAYVTDTLGHCVRSVNSNGVVKTIAGQPNVPGAGDGFHSAAAFNQPTGIAVDPAGNLYVADHDNNLIRKIDKDWNVTTLAGQAKVYGSADGTGTAASFSGPQKIAVDTQGNLFVADTGNHTIRKITPEGVVTTYAGQAGKPGAVDGKRSEALFNYPDGLAFDSKGNLYVADSGNNAIRKISASGMVSTLAGQAGVTVYADGIGKAGTFKYPMDLTVDRNGCLYVTDGNRVRKIIPVTWAKKPKALLDQYRALLKDDPDDMDLCARAIQLVGSMKTKPETPMDYEISLGKAAALFKKAENRDDFKAAVGAFQDALVAAPWKAEVYYNLGLAQEKAFLPLEAINKYKLYILANPNAPDKDKVLQKIGALEVSE